MNGHRMSRRAVVTSWLALVMLLAGLVPMVPAAASDEPTALDEISLECPVAGTTVKAELVVTAPLDSVAVTVDLLANGSIIDTADLVLETGRAVYEIDLELEAADLALASSVVATARMAGDAVSVTSDPLAIAAFEGGVSCVPAGGLPVVQSLLEDPTEVPTQVPPTDVPTQVPTEVPTQVPPTEVPTQVPTQEPGATQVPTEEPSATGVPTDPPATMTGTVVNTNGANLNCRATPNGDIIAKLAAGSTVPVTGATQNGWVPVECGGSAGYVSATYLRVSTSTGSTPPATTTPDTATWATVTGTGGLGLRCRTTPVSGTIITVVPDSTRLAVRGATQSGWVPVTCGGQAGWVIATYVTLSTGGGGTTPTPTPDSTTYATVVNTGGMGLRCRTVAVTGAIITVVPEGARLKVRGATQSGWVPVECGGQGGWVSAAYVSLGSGGTTPTPTPNPSTGGTGRYITVSGTGGGGLRCRTSAPSGTVIGIVAEGARIETRGQMNSTGWFPVICFGQNGWVSASYVIADVAAGTGELWMDVNLSTQYMRVYRGSTIVIQTYVSTGKPGFATPTGTFYINRKLVTRTMTGVLGGEYYYVPNVPWVMYFTNVGHAVHGAYWHNDFGRVRSHGCINLPVPTAEALYRITPIGARLRIHY